MEKVTLLDKTFRLYIPQEEIEKGIDRVAADLEKDNAGKDDIPILLCVLTGSIMFTSEIMKRVHFPCFPGGSAGKESACNVGDLVLIPGLGRSPGEGTGYPLQYSGL